MTGAGTPREGLVVGAFGHTALVEDTGGHLWRCRVPRRQGPVVCGDRVMWLPEHGDQGRVVEVKPRRSALVRPGARGRLKPLAANIDRLLVVVAPAPPPERGLLDRYLVAAELLELPAAIVCNKSDLLDAAARADMEAGLAVYERLGYPVVWASTRTEDGLDALRALLKEDTAIFVGQSGVGKSSLVKALVPEAELRTGALSAASGLGRHTTTAARLYHLPDGGAIIDSPGVRDFHLWPVEPAELARGFREFHPCLGRCRFRDCRHLEEPDCAVRAAVEAGAIDSGRYASYRRLLHAMEEERARRQ